MKKRIQSLITVFLSLPYILINPLSAKADYIHQTLAEYSGTIIEFHINNERVKVILEIDDKDKKVFFNFLDKQQNSITQQNLLQNLQTRKPMELENQGGAVATVKNVKITDIQKQPSAAQGVTAFRTKWIADGTLEHWGHRHNRQNQYDAILTLSPVNNVWKITDIELLSETQIK